MPQAQASVQARVDRSQINRDARDFIFGRGLPMSQPIFSQAVSGTVTTANRRIIVPPKKTGLLTGFLVRVRGSLNNAGASIANRSAHGVLNALRTITFRDPNNITRHQVSGLKLGLLNSLKQARGFGQNVAPNLPYDSTGWIVQDQPATVGIGATVAFSVYYYVPVSYSQNDLKGAIPLNVVNTTAELVLELNDAPGFIAGDPTFAMAGGAGTNVTMLNVTVDVHQQYFDQITDQRGVMIFPPDDVAVQYRIEDSAFGGLVASQDNAFEYGPYRNYLSTTAIFVQGGTVLNMGTDVDFWALRFANSLTQWQYNASDLALLASNQIGFQLPDATYYFDHRAAPLSAANRGNANLILRPLAAAAGSYVHATFEYFQPQALALTGPSQPT